MEKSGLLNLTLPELALCRGVEQKGAHRFDVLDHSLLACDYAARENYSHLLRLAALLHEIGKPVTLRVDETGERTFYRHEAASATITETLLRRLRYPNALIERVTHLAAEHMFRYEEGWSGAAVRRFIIRAGVDHLQDLYDLRLADSFATAGIEPTAELIEPLKKRVEAELAKGRALSLKSLTVSGSDLIVLGFEPGKRLGIVLGQLLEAVLEDPALNTREALLTIAENLRKREG
jgi:tRNA nucleotidyltransferase/poly(A) polymerase